MSNQPVTTPPAVPRNQAWQGRREYMEALVEKAFQSPIRALEIGVWYAAGSTQIWLDKLRPGSNLLLLDSWKPFASEEDMKDEKWDYRGMDNLTTDAFLGAFLNVKKFEAERKDANIKVQMTRGDSQAFLPLLKEEAFDFIYIDADHKYEKAKNDISHAKRLINHKYGIICGDDLEKLPTPELIDLARNNRNKDYLRAPHNFHPGVLLAVAEEFGQVNIANGFWWIACQNGNFTTELLKPQSLGINL